MEPEGSASWRPGLCQRTRVKEPQGSERLQPDPNPPSENLALQSSYLRAQCHTWLGKGKLSLPFLAQAFHPWQPSSPEWERQVEREEDGLFSSAPTASPACVGETCSMAQSFNIRRSEIFYSMRGTRKGCTVCREEWIQRKACRGWESIKVLSAWALCPGRSAKPPPGVGPLTWVGSQAVFQAWGASSGCQTWGSPVLFGFRLQPGFLICHFSCPI